MIELSSFREPVWIIVRIGWFDILNTLSLLSLLQWFINSLQILHEVFSYARLTLIVAFHCHYIALWRNWIVLLNGKDLSCLSFCSFLRLRIFLITFTKIDRLIQLFELTSCHLCSRHIIHLASYLLIVGDSNILWLIFVICITFLFKCLFRNFCKWVSILISSLRLRWIYQNVLNICVALLW